MYRKKRFLLQPEDDRLEEEHDIFLLQNPFPWILNDQSPVQNMALWKNQ